MTSTTSVGALYRRRPLTIAVVGCTHGELHSIYTTLETMRERHGVSVDALLCCGDFQSTRTIADLQSLNCPARYKCLSSFAHYHSGAATAPILTLYIGGNHECSNMHLSLPYGGFVAPNIYYLGFANTVRVNGWSVGGMSGIYSARDAMMGHGERMPLNDSDIRSVYHCRAIHSHQLSLLPSLDILLSHDWPTNIAKHGNTAALLRRKPFLAGEINDGSLGNPLCEQLIAKLRPRYCFAAHMHVKFAAIVNHHDRDSATVIDSGSTSDGGGGDGSSSSRGSDVRQTKFLALDKVLPNKEFLQIISLVPDDYDADADVDSDSGVTFEYDIDWLHIVKATNDYVNMTRTKTPLPTTAVPCSDQSRQSVIDTLTDGGTASLRDRLNIFNSYRDSDCSVGDDAGLVFEPNVQSSNFANMLRLRDVYTEAMNQSQPRSRSQPSPAATHTNPDEINIDDID